MSSSFSVTGTPIWLRSVNLRHGVNSGCMRSEKKCTNINKLNKREKLVNIRSQKNYFIFTD